MKGSSVSAKKAEYSLHSQLMKHVSMWRAKYAPFISAYTYKKPNKPFQFRVKIVKPAGVLLLSSRLASNGRSKHLAAHVCVLFTIAVQFRRATRRQLIGNANLKETSGRSPEIAAEWQSRDASPSASCCSGARPQKRIAKKNTCPHKEGESVPIFIICGTLVRGLRR